MKTDTVLLFKPEVQLKPILAPSTLKKKKRGWKMLTGIFTCFLPTVIAVLYFALMASDQYVTELRFAVRSNETQQLDPLGMLTGLPSGNTLGADSYIVVNFLQSREIVEAVNKTVPLRILFGAPTIDWFARFDKNKPIEYLTRYWKDQIQAQYEPSSTLVRVQIKAFSPHDSLMIGEAILRETENLVNRLSLKARTDAVKASCEWR
jgi:capsular polysaccharide transport system permease protein